MTFGTGAGATGANRMHRVTIRLTALVAAALLAAGGALDAAATSVIPLDLAHIVAAAQQIAHVRCTGNTVVPDAAVGAVTETTFVVLDRVIGAHASTLIVRQAGGERDGLVIDYRVPKFRPGDEYVLFLPAASRLGLASPVGLAQGAFGVTVEASGRTVGNGRDFSELLAGLDQAAMPAGVATRLQRAPAQRLRLDLSDFMALVRARAGTR
jgi:hypothetical protein